jgi:phosphatidylcholine synthase
MLEKVIPLPFKLRWKRKAKSLRKEPKRVALPRERPDALTRVLAWCVHLYTALGLVLAAVIAILLYQGGPEAFRWSFILMGVATFIDATDGTLARKIRIKEVLPNFDGRRLDDITDFLTYTSLPLLLIWRAQLLPAGTEWCLILPLLASAYGFCQCQAKTDDGYFLGFPSLWNVVAFYLYVLRPDGWAALGVLLTLALLTFVPARHLYPSQPGRLNQWGLILGVAWAALLGWALWRWLTPTSAADPRGPETFRSVVLVSLFYPAYYMLASWGLSLRIWLRTRA